MDALRSDAIDGFTIAATASGEIFTRIVKLPARWPVPDVVFPDEWFWNTRHIFVVFSRERDRDIAMLSSAEIGGAIVALAKAWLVTRWPRLFSWLSQWKPS